MFSAQANRQKMAVKDYRTIESPLAEDAAFNTISEDGRSIHILLNPKQNRISPSSFGYQQLQGKIKKTGGLPSLFTDNNFRMPSAPTSNPDLQSHISYLQTLRTLPRKVHNPSNIKVMLKTEYSVIHNLIHKYFNYKFYNKQDQQSDIFLIWIDTYVTQEFIKRIKSYQRINHFPSSCQLGRKDLLAVNLNQAKAFMPELYQFYPKTWVLPRDFQAFTQREGNSFYIIKPHANCQGRGIYLSKNPSLTCKDQVIVQQYIENPMLIDGCKFDLRVYVLVRSLDPLKVFVYEDGLCRLATSKYSQPNESNFKNDKMHLTNYAINKFAPNFVGNRDFREDNKGHKRSLTSALKTLQTLGFDISKIRDRIDSIILRSILAAYTKMLQSYRKTRESSVNFRNFKEFISYKEEPHRSNSDGQRQESVCFELLGFDILLLDTGEPILLEINHQPSLVTDSPLDLNIKRSLIMDTINILNLQESDRQLWEKSHLQLTPTKAKHTDEKELQSCGGYRRIYPLSHIKLHQKSQEEAAVIRSHTELYEGMINRIMFREFKRLSKLKMANYKTISTRNKVHLSKFQKQDGRTNLSAPRTAQTMKNVKYQNQKSVALTFYNLFNNSKYVISKSGEQEKESETQLQDKIIKNHIMLESIEKGSIEKRKKPMIEISLKPGRGRQDEEKIDLKPKPKREEFYQRKQENHCKLPQFFMDRQLNKDGVTLQQQGEEMQRISKNIRWNLLSTKNKGIVHYISSNKSKNAIINKTSIEQTRNPPAFSNPKLNISNPNDRSHPKTNPKTDSNPQDIRDSNRKELQSQSLPNDSPSNYKDIYSNSIRQKMDKINNLKIIKNNLHKLNFINFVQRTKCARKAVNQSQLSPQQQF